VSDDLAHMARPLRPFLIGGDKRGNKQFYDCMIRVSRRSASIFSIFSRRRPPSTRTRVNLLVRNFNNLGICAIPDNSMRLANRHRLRGLPDLKCREGT